MSLKKYSSLLIILLLTCAFPLLVAASTSKTVSVEEQKLLEKAASAPEELTSQERDIVRKIMDREGYTASTIDGTKIFIKDGNVTPIPQSSSPSDDPAGVDVVPKGKELTSSVPRAGSSSNVINCFDYYRFGSAQVDVSVESLKHSIGSTVTASGTVRNLNDYPIVDVSVVVKVFRKQLDSDKAQAEGHNVVDFFVVKDNITIPAKGELPILISWNYTGNAAHGD